MSTPPHIHMNAGVTINKTAFISGNTTDFENVSGEIYAQNGRVWLSGYWKALNPVKNWLTVDLTLPEWAHPETDVRISFVAAGAKAVLIVRPNGIVSLYSYEDLRKNESIPFESISWPLKT